MAVPNMFIRSNTRNQLTATTTLRRTCKKMTASFMIVYTVIVSDHVLGEPEAYGTENS